MTSAIELAFDGIGFAHPLMSYSTLAFIKYRVIFSGNLNIEVKSLRILVAGNSHGMGYRASTLKHKNSSRAL